MGRRSAAVLPADHDRAALRRIASPAPPSAGSVSHGREPVLAARRGTRTRCATSLEAFPRAR
jgi:hypothetical protein